MSPVLRRSLLGVGALGCLLVLAHLAVFRFVPVQGYLRGLARRVADDTGGEVRIGGGAHLSLLPRLTLRLREVGFARTPGAGLPDLLAADELHLQLRVLPLLRGRLAVHRAVLHAPTLSFVTTADGRRNWTPVPATASDQGRPVGAGTDRNATALDLQLDDVSIVNGAIQYWNETRGRQLALTGVNLRAFAPAWDGPLSAEGWFSWNGGRVRLMLDAANLRHLAEGRATRLTAEARSADATARYGGEVRLADGVVAAGSIEGHVPSVRAFLSRVGHPLPTGGPPVGSLSVAAQMTAVGGLVTWTETEVQLADARGSGTVQLSLGGSRPRLSARAALDRMDLTPFFPPAADDPAADPSSEPEAAEAPEWSENTVPLTWLSALDADVELLTEALTFRRLTLDAGRLTGSLADGHLALAISEATAHGGGVRGWLALREGEGGAETAAVLIAEGVEAGPLLEELFGTPYATGSATVFAAAEATGGSVRELVGCLQGRGALTVVNGSLRGVDLAGVTGNVARVVLRRVRAGEKQTPFGRATGSFRIRDGNVRSRDLLLRAPGLTLEGEGLASLVGRSVDYRFMLRRPWMSLPVSVAGPWQEIGVRAGLPRPLPLAPAPRTLDDEAAAGAAG